MRWPIVFKVRVRRSSLADVRIRATDSQGREVIVESDPKGDHVLKDCKVSRLGPGDVPRKAYHRVRVVERR